MARKKITPEVIAQNVATELTTPESAVVTPEFYSAADEKFFEELIEGITSEERTEHFANQDIEPAEQQDEADTGLVHEFSAEDDVDYSDPSDEPEFEEEPQQLDFLDILPGEKDASTMAMRQEMAEAIDIRLEFEEEKAKETGKDNIFRTLSKVREKLVTSASAAQVFVAVGISDAGFFNRVLHDGSRYNVYAAGKLADQCEALVKGVIGNAINRAIVKSLFAVDAAGGTFTMELAKAACSKQYRVDSPYSRNLVRHTVSPSTAPTQSSSTMQALQTLGIVRLSGSRKHAAYELVDSPATRRLKEVAQAA